MRKLSINKKILLPVILLILVVVVGVVGYHKARPTPGVYLDGPVTQIKLGKTYTYTVKIVSDTSYKQAVIFFSAPPSGYQATRNVSLTAHQAWKGTFKVVFTSTNSMNKEGLAVGVTVLPPHSGYKTLFNKIYSVKPLPNQKVYVPAHKVKYDPPSYFGS